MLSHGSVLIVCLNCSPLITDNNEFKRCVYEPGTFPYSIKDLRDGPRFDLFADGANRPMLKGLSILQIRALRVVAGSRCPYSAESVDSVYT